MRALRDGSVLGGRPDESVTDAVARTYGALAAAVVAAGRQPRSRSFDLVIAATAATHEAVLYTRNPKDFVGLDDQLQVIAV
jgi:predicted nucleic acid-binding protein